MLIILAFAQYKLQVLAKTKRHKKENEVQTLEEKKKPSTSNSTI